MDSEIIMRQTEGGFTRIETIFENEAVWSFLGQIAELFSGACSIW